MANLYKRYMRLLDKWPLDKSKEPDLGQYIRDQIKIAFPKGERSTVSNEQECLKKLESLERLAANVYGKRYPVKVEKLSTGLSLEVLNAALTPQIQELLQQEKKGLTGKIKNTIWYYFSNKPEPEKK